MVKYEISLQLFNLVPLHHHFTHVNNGNKVCFLKCVIKMYFI